MRSSLLFMGIFVAIFMIWAGLRGDGTLSAGLRASWTNGLQFLPVLLMAFLLMGMIEALTPKNFVQQWLAEGAGVRGIFVGWIAGILTPAGSIIGMPIAAGLYKAGASTAVLVTYLTSLATLSMIRIPLEIGFYGWKLMLLRVASNLFLPLIAGFTVYGISRLITPSGS
ncbi:MAG: permease [Myxococcales bacterium]|nr:permease [Myxococcales bacterium]